MSSYKREQFSEIVVRHIKYKPDRNDIKIEIEDHIEDLKESFLSQGLNENEAEKKAVEEMGDPDQIGRELNKEHSPLMGYLWQASNILLIIVSIVFISQLVAPLLISLEPPKQFDATSEILYEMDLDETLQVDDVIYDFQKMIYEENGEVTLLYRYYYKSILDRIRYKLPVYYGLTFSTDMGTVPFGYHERRDDSLYMSYQYVTFEDFDSDSTVFYAHFDVYDRHYQVDIPLNWGDADE